MEPDEAAAPSGADSVKERLNSMLLQRKLSTQEVSSSRLEGEAEAEPEGEGEEGEAPPPSSAPPPSDDQQQQPPFDPQLLRAILNDKKRQLLLNPQLLALLKPSK